MLDAMVTGAPNKVEAEHNDEARVTLLSSWWWQSGAILV
jgi:hypothetical protein